MDRVDVEGHSNLKRDVSSGAIVNTDSTEYENYLRIREEKEKERLKLDNALRDISLLKSELTEIKNLILNLGNNHGRL